MASIDDEDLKILIAAGLVKAQSIEEIVELPDPQCVEARCIHKASRDWLYLEKSAVKNVGMHMHIIFDEDRM